MKKSLIFTVIICLFIILSCDTSGENTETYGDSINIIAVTGKALLAPEYGAMDPAVRSAALGANDFTFRLGAELVKDNDGDNFVCSPFSVWIPLAALVNATDAEYKDMLLTALGAAGITQNDINKAASRMLYDLTNQNKKGQKNYYNSLKIANAIFVSKEVTLQKDFAQTFMDYYRGSSINVDFRSDEAVDAVNRWVSNNTEGLIKNMVEEFDPESAAVIANAIYFLDKWSWKFDSEETKKDVFFAPDETVNVPFMLREGSDQTYYEDDNIQAIRLTYENGGGLYILLPKSGGAKELLSSMDSSYFSEIQANSWLAKGKLLLPRFSVQNDVNLKDSLIKLGVPLFEKSPLTELIEENIPLVITDAKQKALIKVDEKGTTAAAVTVIVVGPTSAGPQPNKPFEMICNKPFVFILYGDTYEGGKQILFTGIVNKP